MSARNVVVTGAAGGLGRALVAAHAAAGATVIAVDVDEDGLRDVVDAGRVIPVVADVRSETGAEAVVAAADRRVDVLCNNAGVMDGFAQVDEVSTETWDRVLGVNLTGAFVLARAVLPTMLDRGRGSIVNIASVAGLRGGRAGAAYTVSKFGLVGLTMSIAAAYGAQGVRCNAICPGGIETAINAQAGATSAGQLLRDRDTAKPRRADPAEVAAVAAFLASDAASYVNGAVMPVDGGWLAY